jgi:RHS repeat-associated protein
VGNILSINNETPACGVGGSGSLLREFDYDALYRLISGTGRENQPTPPAFPGWNDTTRSDTVGDTTAYTQYYSYDRMGNFDEFQHVADNSSNNFTRTFDYVSGKNLLESITIGSNSYSFDYDNNGNLITENTERHFEWDYADQMRCFYIQDSPGNQPSVYSMYLYAGGARVKKITRKSSGDKYVTVYIDGIFEHSYHLDGSNAMDEELNELHVMDDQTRVAMLRTGYDDGTPFTKYILSDHLGSSNVILETSGAVYNREEYYPFGETSFGAFGKKRYRYVGKEKDEESGLYYYGMRYYQPWSCRFISVDPLAADYPFYTPYQYAGNQPINFIDLDGAEQAPAPGDSTSQPTPQAPSSGTTPTTSPAATPSSNNLQTPNSGEPQAQGSFKGCCVNEPVVNGSQGPHSSQYVKQQKQIQIQEQKAAAQETAQEQKKMEFVQNMNNPSYMAQFYLERALESVEKVSDNPSSGEMISPVKDPVIISGIGKRDVKSVKGASKDHKGLDIQIAPPGITNEASVVSPVNGTIVDIQTKNQGSVNGKKAGNRIVIKDSNGQYHHFFHLADKDFAKGLKIGMPVKQGIQIGRIGNTSTLDIKVHLHYEIRGGMYSGKVFDPSKINPGLKSR